MLNYANVSVAYPGARTGVLLNTVKDWNTPKEDKGLQIDVINTAKNDKGLDNPKLTLIQWHSHGGGGCNTPVKPQMTSYITKLCEQNALLVKHAKLGAKNMINFHCKLFKKHESGHCSMEIFKCFPGEHASGPPYSRFWHLGCLKLTLPEKNTLEKSDENWCRLPEKISEYASDMKHFSKGLFTSVSEFQRLCI